MLKKGAIILFFLFSAIALKAQVTMAPLIVYIDPASKMGEFEVNNTSDDMVEIEISFRFSYFVSDSLGNSKLVWEDSSNSPRNLTPYLKVFPKKAQLKAKTSQRVKFLLFMPPELEDGLYWTRIITKVLPKANMIDTIKTENGVSAGVVIIREFANSIVYQKGKQITNLSAGEPSVKLDSSLVTVFFDMEQTGNAPTWAAAHFRILDEAGKQVDELLQTVAIYDKMRTKFMFDKGKFKPGRYTAEYKFSGERDDIPREKRTLFEPITGKFEFNVNGTSRQ